MSSINPLLAPQEAEVEGFIQRGGGSISVDPGLNPLCILNSYSPDTLAKVQNIDPVAAYAYAYYLYDRKGCSAFPEIKNSLIRAFESKIDLKGSYGEISSVYRVPEAGHFLYGVATVCLEYDEYSRYEYYYFQSFIRGLAQPGITL
ncbi:hypothetical protein [Asticcacaulis sp. MM231]|uniref:hypothetical protein n=1 Tax=Asticcacaulis sp. MM231 TaxID=3157666 RepID=UPI0032D58DB2